MREYSESVAVTVQNRTNSNVDHYQEVAYGVCHVGEPASLSNDEWSYLLTA